MVPGARVHGITHSSPVSVVDIRWHGGNALTVTYRDDHGGFDEAVLYREHEPNLRMMETSAVAAFDAAPSDFKLAMEAQRIRMAARFDPMLAVSTSDLEPLPHQLKAVYAELLPRTPLRFLLADDPGAGKTIMAGLYIKELLLRGDLARCLIVAPGGLVDQWQEELYSKFGLRFDLLTRSMIEADLDGDMFSRHPLLIAKMDQLSRSEELNAALEHTDWDLTVVDEAHRMSAHYVGQERKLTKRYQLGLLLGRISRHLLLMTATPHAGKEEDFQLFMALLDSDRFEGRFRDGVHSIDTDGLMRRMVKEELLTFDGKPLFPERRASTVPYDLSAAEQELYELVTQYVREEMNRADRLRAQGDGRRSSTVGFALTVLQRRLASSPEAIWRSLERRRKRLQRSRADLTAGPGRAPSTVEQRLAALLGPQFGRPDEAVDDELDELAGGEVEQLEEDVVDAATAARTAAELDVEIRQLQGLEELARLVRQSGEDTKWTQLRTLLTDNDAITDASGNLRKIIIFTEHRDTLVYLVERIRTLIGRDGAVVAIHGGIGREERRKVQELFTQDKDVAVLVATDAAGEGLNLQRSHLMVNYDLPWNPNRIEQRFGRIHRIGQKQVCHLWNLVAAGTREGAVFLRLLDKIEEMRRAYAGKIFDVLGEAFDNTPLRTLLVEAIRYGDQPEVRARLDRVIDASVSDGIDQLLAERALNHQVLATAELNDLRLAMDEARARRLQPHYIKAFFLEAFRRLGGRSAERETGRYEITHVPAAVRERDRIIGTGAPVLHRYERVTFRREQIHLDGRPTAQLLAPGHPLHDAVIDLTIEHHSTALKHGTVFVDPDDPGDEPRLLAAITSTVHDGRGRAVSRRFEFVELTPDGQGRATGPAPYLDYEPPTTGDQPAVATAMAQPWLRSGPDQVAVSWAIGHGSRDHLLETRAQTAARTDRTRATVTRRLRQEINYWDMRSVDLADQESQGRNPAITADTASRRARDLERRLDQRLDDLALDDHLTASPPTVAGYALVIPRGYLDRAGGTAAATQHTRNTEQVDQRAIAAVMAAERALGRTPTELAHNHPGYDIASITPDEQRVITIEVKGRIAGADDVTITKNEVLTGKNKGTQHRLALVSVSPDGPAGDRVRYLVDPFADEPDPAFDTTRVTKNWNALWDRAGDPQ